MISPRYKMFPCPHIGIVDGDSKISNQVALNTNTDTFILILAIGPTIIQVTIYWGKNYTINITKIVGKTSKSYKCK